MFLSNRKEVHFTHFNVERLCVRAFQVWNGAVFICLFYVWNSNKLYWLHGYTKRNAFFLTIFSSRWKLLSIITKSKQKYIVEIERQTNRRENVLLFALSISHCTVTAAQPQKHSPTMLTKLTFSIREIKIRSPGGHRRTPTEGERWWKFSLFHRASFISSIRRPRFVRSGCPMGFGRWSYGFRSLRFCLHRYHPTMRPNERRRFHFKCHGFRAMNYTSLDFCRDARTNGMQGC